MGYYVTLTDSNFVIPETPEVLAAIKEMDTKFDAIKRGGSYGPEGKTEKWFSWMPQLSGFESVRAVFEALGFDCYDGTEPDSFYLQSYDSKTGQEDLFLAVVAPFVRDGSYTEWRGEDGALYRYEVRNGRLVQSEARIEWTDPQPYAYAHFDSVGSFGDGSYRMISIVVDPYTDDETIIDNLIEDAAHASA
jgi:hypothetical protein